MCVDVTTRVVTTTDPFDKVTVLVEELAAVEVVGFAKPIEFVLSLSDMS